MVVADRRPLVLVSLVLGLLVLAAVPLHAELRADEAVLGAEDYLDPACRTPVHVFPEPICPRIVAGESPAMVFFALILVPLLASRPGRGALLAIAGLSAASAVLQLVAPFALDFPALGGERPSPFEVEPGCGLVNCGLDHTLFHLAQVPFLAAMAAMAYRLARDG